MPYNSFRIASVFPLVVFILGLLAISACAAKLKLLTDPKKTCSAIQLSGELFPGDFNRFSAILTKASAIAPVRRLYLNSQGGQVLAALAINDLIRQKAPKVETIVLSRHICNSACVTLLTVGTQKYVSRRAAVLIHRAYDPKTKKTDIEVTKQQGEFMVANGMPQEVMQTMGGLRPKQEIQITRSSAKKLGFESFKFFSGANPPATPGCSWKGPAPNNT